MYLLQTVTTPLFQNSTTLSFLNTNSHWKWKHTFTSTHVSKPPIYASASTKWGSKPEPEPKPSNYDSKPRTRTRRPKLEDSRIQEKNADATKFPTTVPRKPRRGRRSEAMAVEDYIRDTLESTFSRIREQNPEMLEGKGKVMKERVDDEVINSETDESEDEDEDDDEDEDENEEAVSSDERNAKRKNKRMVVEEESKDWPLDADVGWGIRASEYFEQHPIRNVVGEDGVEIDWEGEVDDNWVKEINCLEWESFAFNPSPLIVLVFERYKRATDNWRTLKELEKATKVYWSAKDRLPPRTVKIDINIEKDLAYALKSKDCPQILFLRGNRIIHREKEFRTADDLVQMIAHFYYNAKKPSCMNDQTLSTP